MSKMSTIRDKIRVWNNLFLTNWIFPTQFHRIEFNGDYVWSIYIVSLKMKISHPISRSIY